MRRQSKLLALGLLAACAIGAGATASAGAQTGGHFTPEIANATLKATESPTHRLEFSLPGSEPIICNEVTYAFAGKWSTFEFFRLFLGTERTCQTTKGDPGTVKIKGNECGLLFRIGKKRAQHNTTDIFCEAGKGPIEVIHPNCTMKVPAQVGFNGVSYTNITENGKHVVTAQLTVGGEGGEFDVYYESGICVFLGTTHSMVVTGSFTFKAFNDAGAQVHLTATGSED